MEIKSKKEIIYILRINNHFIVVIEKIRNFLETDPDFKLKIPKNLKDTDSLIETGVIDSFGVINLISFIEKAFSIKVEIEDLTEETFSTLKNIEGYIIRKLIRKPQ